MTVVRFLKLTEQHPQVTKDLGVRRMLHCGL